MHISDDPGDAQRALNAAMGLQAADPVVSVRVIVNGAAVAGLTGTRIPWMCPSTPRSPRAASDWDGSAQTAADGYHQRWTSSTSSKSSTASPEGSAAERGRVSAMMTSHSRSPSCRSTNSCAGLMKRSLGFSVASIHGGGCGVRDDQEVAANVDLGGCRASRSGVRNLHKRVQEAGGHQVVQAVVEFPFGQVCGDESGGDAHLLAVGFTVRAGDCGARDIRLTRIEGVVGV